MLISVDLPEPDAPVIATNSPRAMSRSTPSRARTSVSPAPYTLLAARSESSGASGVEPIGRPPGGRQVDQHAVAGAQSGARDLHKLAVIDARRHGESLE